jgi:hypothetical protein
MKPHALPKSSLYSRPALDESCANRNTRSQSKINSMSGQSKGLRMKLAAAIVVAALIVSAGVLIAASSFGHGGSRTKTVSSSSQQQPALVDITGQMEVNRWIAAIPNILNSGGYGGMGNDCPAPAGCSKDGTYPAGSTFTVDASYGANASDINTLRVDNATLCPTGVFTVESVNATFPIMLSPSDPSVNVVFTIKLPEQPYNGTLTVFANITALSYPSNDAIASPRSGGSC